MTLFFLEMLVETITALLEGKEMHTLIAMGCNISVSMGAGDIFATKDMLSQLFFFPVMSNVAYK